MRTAVDPRDTLYDRALELTSEFRNAVVALGEDLPGAGTLEALGRTGKALGELARQTELQALQRSTRLLERTPALAAAVRSAEPAECRALLASTHEALGVAEQLLFSWPDAADAERQGGLADALLRGLPERWRALLDGDAEAFESRIRSYLAPPVAAAAAAPLLPDTAIAPELIQAFDQEAGERLQRCEEVLVVLERTPDDADLLQALFRELHTLKGAAAEVGLDTARTQLHQGESLLAAVRDGTMTAPPDALFDFLFRLIDSVRGIVDHACGRPVAAQTIIADVAAEIGRFTTTATTGGTAASGPLASMAADLAHNLDALAQLRAKLGSEERDEEILQLIAALDKQTRESTQIARGLQEQLDQLRTVPLQSVLRRLVRPVRDAARQEGKQVELKLIGGETRVDRSIAEALHGPLLHIVRNAVSHGIEPPAERQTRGKRPTGTVRVQARQQNGRLVVAVDDDGAGLDYDAIRARAEAKGWIDAGTLPARQELARFILRPGFSTRSEVSELAGRGVGMDVVAREIEALNGRVEIESLEGHGTSIQLTVPLASVAGTTAAE